MGSTNLTESIQARFTAFQYSFDVLLESLANKAKQDIGIPYKLDSQQAAYKRMEALSPLYAQVICVYGELWQNLYDDAPGYEHYSSESSKSQDLPENCGLSEAKALAENFFKELGQDYEALYDRLDVYHGLFVPKLVVIIDQFGGEVAEFKSDKWNDVSDLPNAEEWTGILEEAKTLTSEASEESRWDNFTTANCLRSKAANLERRVSMAKCHARVVN